MERYVCIHGHFYQPPRENPWLEAIELQDSAYPFHDWNERITHECYAPNAASRILDREERIERIVNNYARMSFNFGPTLLSWLEARKPEVYRALLEADRESRMRFDGHGSALAQAHGHLILPLASERDRRTQVLWGLRDFQRRFGRRPEGMWLPETAACVPTLETLAEHGIAFTVLAPHQAARVRRKGERAWTDVSAAGVDPTMAYQAALPSGRPLGLFFYDGPVSRAVAFERLLSNGLTFVERLLGAFRPERGRPQLVHIATDGETYGHHHRHGDMALAWALHHLETGGKARLTNYGEYLERHPPTHEVEIAERTSWSCAHGVERWRSDCGCNSGFHPGFRQTWRGPLRVALDWLRDRVAPLFATGLGRLLHDPWAARDGYIEVLLDRSRPAVERFLARHAGRALDPGETVQALKLLELQRQAMSMYTSCGWFFDEVSGIETVQVLRHAGRAVQLARELFGDGTEEGFLGLLARAPSNLPEMGDARRVYEKLVEPADWEKVAAHHAVTALFEDSAEPRRIHCYTVESEGGRTWQAGHGRLHLGRARFTSAVTLESARLAFAVVHLGDHNLTAAVKRVDRPAALASAEEDLARAFALGDLPEIVRLMRRHFGATTYSLKSLFKDEQRAILESVLQSSLAEDEAAMRRIHERRAPLLRLLAELKVPPPKVLRSASEVVLNSDLRSTFAAAELDLDAAARLLAEARASGIALDAEGLGFVLREALERLMDRLVAAGALLEPVDACLAGMEMVAASALPVDLWRVQNGYYRMLEGVYPGVRARAARGDGAAARWVEAFRRLGERLHVRARD